MVERIPVKKLMKDADPTVNYELHGGEEIRVPAVVAGVGKRLLGWAQKVAYEKGFETKVTGKSYVPALISRTARTSSEAPFASTIRVER